MELQLTFRHLDPSDALRVRAEERAGRLQKLISQPAHAHVVFDHEAPIGVQLHVRGGAQCEAHANNDDIYTALDMAFDKAEQQLRRDHDRRSDKSGK